MNAKIIEGLKAVREGIDLILEGVSEKTTPVVEEGVKREVKEVAVFSPAESKEESTSDLTREQLDGMTYNNIKKLAKERGVSAVGNREEITARLLGEADDESVEEATAKEVPTKKPVKKIEPVEEEVDEDEDDEDPIYAQVVEAVAEMSNEDIADILADIGMSAKGKREALIEKVVQAVKEGLLDFDDEDDEDDDEEEVEETPAPAKKAKKEAPAPVKRPEAQKAKPASPRPRPKRTTAR